MRFLTRLMHKAYLLLLAACSLETEERKSCAQESLAVGGQAVMEGIMMRNGSRLAIAVRQNQEDIVVRNMPWFSITRKKFARRPFLRGFPLLLETMINGIKALNVSAEMAIKAEGEELKPWQLILTLCVALGFAVLLFVLLPHFLTLLLQYMNLSGGVEGFSFHIWDGLIKFAIFLVYIAGISLLPDIRRVFQYHGAEHKSIHAYETGKNPITVDMAKAQSRLHPRCGTTFLLFVLSIAILIHVLLLPLLLLVWTPENPVAKHALLIFVKLLLMAPISALAYEAIRYAAGLGDGICGRLSRGPGLALQRLTTREPDDDQLEVGLVSLHEALKAGPEQYQVPIITPPYTVLEQD